MELKIGILLPRSDMFPTLALDFLNGCKLAFKKSMHTSSIPIFIVEGIGTGAEASMLKTAEKLILQENVDVTIAFCGEHHLAELVKIFDNYKKPLIHVDLGGFILRKEFNSPHVLHHNLNLWQSAFQSGSFAAQKFGKKVSVIASTYDGGYHMGAAFSESFGAAGGSVVSYYVSPMDYKTETFEKMVSEIEAAKPDFIYAIFSYKEGKKIFDVLSKSKINGQIPILAIPLMTDESFNSENLDLENVHSIASWSFDDEHVQMKEFVTEYDSSYDGKPTIIGLLGYEVGITLSECISSEGKVPSELVEFFKGKSWEAPRGVISYGTRNESQVTNYKMRKFEFNEVGYHNLVVENLDAQIDKKLYEKLEDLPAVAWHNPYICT